MKDKWLKDLRDALSDYEMDAPEGLWESIQEDMSVGTEPFSSALLKQSHNRKTWHRNLIAAASIAAALTVGTVIGLWFGKDKRLDSDEIKIAVENRDKLQNSNIPQNKDNSFSVCEETVVQKATVVRNNNIVILCQTVSTSSVDTVMQSKPETIISEDIIDERPLDIEETSGNKNVDECEIYNDDKQQQKSANLFGPRKRTQSNPTTHYANLRLNIKRNKTQESKYYVGLITSGMSSVDTDMKRKIDNPNYVEPDYVDPGSNNPGQNTDPGNTDPDNNFSIGVGVGEGKEPNDKIPDDNPPGSNDNDDDSANSIPTVPEPPVVDNDKYIDEITKVRHRQPVRFGLTFQYNFSKRVGIETGVMYTRLNSDVTTYSAVKAETGNQTLHYVGVPLNIKFSAWSWKWFNLYLSAGVTGEKCVRNEYVTATIASNTYNEIKSSHGEKPFQWSANFGAGLQIRLAPTIGIFAEPGISYYFDDGSSLTTIYKEKPCNFNLNFGIRLTFGN